MRLLDLFCGAGGAAMGYYQAGFGEIVGVDHLPQPRYPFEFIQADALEFLAQHGREFDVIHASPPCQRFSECTPVDHRDKHPDLIGPTCKLLARLGKPYVIENVELARKHLKTPIMLCGSMFGLPIWRHRYFEIWPKVLFLTPSCNHSFRPILITGQGQKYDDNGKRYPKPSVAEKREAMDIDWMIGAEITEAIPPAYTEWIGKQLLELVYA